jgi:hypothetical protein
MTLNVVSLFIWKPKRSVHYHILDSVRIDGTKLNRAEWNIMELSGAGRNGTQISFRCLDIQWWNRIKLWLHHLGSEQNEINYNIFILILPLFKNMEVEEIIKCNKKMKNSNYLIYRFQSIVYLSNWTKWNIRGKDSVRWNEFHLISYHSIHLLKIQTMESNFMSLHISFHFILFHQFKHSLSYFNIFVTGNNLKSHSAIN